MVSISARRVHDILLSYLLVSLCLPMISSFAPCSMSRSNRYRTQQSKYYHKLPSSLRISTESLTSTKETPTPYQMVDGESKVVKRKSGIKVSSRAGSKTKKPTNIYTVTESNEYRDIVENFKDSIIVTRFHAKWCKACQATAPLFHRLARKNPGIIFIEVPVQAENSDLHQGLNVPSVPFSRIYYPTAGLVEEMQISKKRWPTYEKVVATYVQAFCTVEDGNYSNHMLCKTDLPY